MYLFLGVFGKRSVSTVYSEVSFTVSGYNGLPSANQSAIFERPHLTAEIQQLVVNKNEKFVVLASPPATGKTSILQLLFMNQALGDNDVEYYLLTMTSQISAFDQLAQIGLVWKGNNWSYPDLWREKSSVVIMMDDSLKTYDNAAFWEILIKAGYKLPPKVCFIIASTYFLGGKSSHVDFGSLPHLILRNFMLSEEDSKAFLLNNNGLHRKFHNMISLLQIIVRESKGVIGIIRIAADHLNEIYKEIDNPREEDVISQYLSRRTTNRFSRCFGDYSGIDHPSLWDPVVRKLIIDLFGDAFVAADEATRKELSYLIERGYLVVVEDEKNFVPGIEFSSPLAKRYFSIWFYPNRNESNTFPDSILDL